MQKARVVRECNDAQSAVLYVTVAARLLDMFDGLSHAQVDGWSLIMEGYMDTCTHLRTHAAAHAHAHTHKHKHTHAGAACEHMYTRTHARTRRHIHRFSFSSSPHI
jgi:hypothetical protein